MDWEAEGLLEGLEDEGERKARRELLDYLHDEGSSVEDLRQAVKEDRLVLLPVERFLAGSASYTQREIAEKSGFALEHLTEFRQALGLAVPDPDARVYTDEDLETAKDAAALAEIGFPFEETLEVTRVLGRGMSRYAEALRVLFAQTFLEPGDSEVELARRLDGRGRRAAAAVEPDARPRLPPAHPAGAAHRLHRARRAHLGQGLRHLGDDGRVRRPRRLHGAGGDGRGRGAGRPRGPAGEAGGQRRPAAGAGGQADRRRGDARLTRRPGHDRDLPRAGRARGRARRTSRRCGRASPTARPSTAGATGSARPSTSPAA